MTRYNVIRDTSVHNAPRWGINDTQGHGVVVWLDNQQEAQHIVDQWNQAVRTRVTFNIEVTVEPALADALPGDPGVAATGNDEGIPPMTGIEVAAELMLTDLSRYLHDRWYDKLNAVTGITTVRVESNQDNAW